MHFPSSLVLLFYLPSISLYAAFVHLFFSPLLYSVIVTLPFFISLSSLYSYTLVSFSTHWLCSPTPLIYCSIAFLLFITTCMYSPYFATLFFLFYPLSLLLLIHLIPIISPSFTLIFHPSFLFSSLLSSPVASLLFTPSRMQSPPHFPPSSPSLLYSPIASLLFTPSYMCSPLLSSFPPFPLLYFPNVPLPFTSSCVRPPPQFPPPLFYSPIVSPPLLFPLACVSILHRRGTPVDAAGRRCLNRWTRRPTHRFPLIRCWCVDEAGERKQKKREKERKKI